MELYKIISVAAIVIGIVALAYCIKSIKNDDDHVDRLR